MTRNRVVPEVPPRKIEGTFILEVLPDGKNGWKQECRAEIVGGAVRFTGVGPIRTSQPRVTAKGSFRSVSHLVGVLDPDFTA